MHWYCVHTRPKKEPQVVDYCRNMLGLETYYPRLRQQKTIRRVRRVVTNPLFPRYFFCRFDAPTSYRQVRYAPETIDIVHVGRHPAVVNPSLIDELKQWAGDAVDVVTLQPTLRPGDRVEITDGPMRGLSAVILHASEDRDRVAILLSILECGAQMTISRSGLKRLS
ncbi:MAG TPA: transcription termination/antitermination NusG family protein [Opitutaceae bacterium]|nr:transcription termination/antitermination NusG family protein [Opitutaceae bacterium]